MYKNYDIIYYLMFFNYNFFKFEFGVNSTITKS